MGIRNRDGALYAATGIDCTGFYEGRREAIGIIKAMAGQITSFDVFSGIGISAATAFAQAAKSSYDFEKEFRKNMLEVATISTQVEGSMTDFMNQVMSITQVIPIKAPEAAKALYQIVSAGHDGADGMNVLEVAAKSAIGGITDTVTAADAITTLLNAYKLSADDAEKVSDQLFTTARLGKTTFGEMGQSIAQVAPIAAAYGVEMDQVLAAIATLTKSGTPTAQAMTQIRASIIGTSKVLGDGAFDCMTFQEALAEIANRAGGSEAKLRELIPEVEAVNGVLGLTGIKAQDAADHLKEMNNSAGATEAAFKLMMNDVDKQMTLLSNNIQAALRPMGQAILKEVSEVATAFNEAFESGDVKEAMKTLGELIVVVTGAFIGYKGSVLGSAAAHNIYARAMVLSRLAAIKHVTTMQLMTNAIKVQTVALLKNAAAFLTNPYVLAAAAVAALGYAVYKYATQATAAEKAQYRYNSRIEEQKQLADEMKGKTDQLLEVVKDETETNYQRNKALKTLKELYPSIFKQYDIEALKLADVLNIKKQIAEIDEQRNFQSDKSYYASIVNKRDKIDKELSYRSGNYGNGQYKYGEFQSKTVNELKKEREGIAKEIDLMYSDIREKSAAIWEKSAPKEVKIVSLEKNVESLKKEQEELNTLINGEKEGGNPIAGIASPVDIARLEVVNGLIKEQSEELNSLKKISNPNGTVAGSSVSKEIADTTTNIAKLKQELADLRSGKTFAKAGKTVQSAIEDKTKELKAAEDALSVLTGQTTKETSDRLKLQSDLSHSILESELKLQADRIAIIQDGKDKRVLLADQEYKETLATILKEKEEYQKKVKESKGKEDPAVLKTFDNRELSAKNKRNTNVANINKDYVKELRDREKEISSVFLTEEAKRLSAVKDRYDKERQWAKDQYETGGMNEDQYGSYLRSINNAETQDNTKSLLAKYQDYSTQRQEIERQFNEEIATLNNNRTDQNSKEIDRSVAEVQRRMKEALSGLDLEKFQKEMDWSVVFGDLDNLSTSTLEKLRGKLSKYINEAAKDLKPEDLKTLQDAFKDIDFKLTDRDPFASLKTSMDEYKSSTEAVKKAQQDLADVQSGKAITASTYYDKATNQIVKVLLTQEQAEKNLHKAEDKRQESMRKMNTSIHSAAEKGKEYLGVASSVLGMLNDFGVEVPEEVATAVDGLGKSMESLASIDLMKPFSVITGAIGVIGGLGEAIGGLFGKANEVSQKTIDQYNALIDVLDQVIDRHNTLMDGMVGSTAVAEYERSIELINKQREATKRLALEYLGSNAKNEHTYGYRLTKELEGLENEFNRIGISWDKIHGSGRMEGLFDLSADELRTIQEDLPEAWARLDDKTRDYLQTIIDCDDKASGLRDTLEQTINQVSFDSVQDGFLDVLSNMDSSQKDLADNFEKYMQKAILNSMVVDKYKGKLKDWYKAFTEANKDGIDIDEYKRLQQDWNSMAQSAIDERNSLKDLFNWAPEKEEESDNTLKGAYAKASQESIDLLAGQTGAMRVVMEDIKGQIQPIREQMQFIRELQVRGWEDVRVIRVLSEKIDKNSEQVANNTAKIKEVADKISENTRRSADALDGGTINAKVKM